MWRGAEHCAEFEGADMRTIIAAVMAALAFVTVAWRVERAADSQQKTPSKESPLHQGGYLNSYIALLKSDLKPRKKGFIAEGLRLTEKEAAVFWPIYQSYESDLKLLEEARLQLIKDYADHYSSMNDAKALELVEKRLTLEGQQVALKRTYFKRLGKVLPGKTVARFFQLEYRFGLLTEVKTVSGIPLIE
jgi:hypothetical protein